MKRLLEAIKGIAKGLVKAVSRFPLTVLCLIAATILVCYMISLHKTPDVFIQKLMYTCLLGAFIGVAAQFGCERFERLARWRVLTYVVSVLLVGAYYLSLWSAQSIDFDVQIRTFVAVFAMFSLYLWVPSYKGGSNFNSIALIHFKAAFTSILYSAVLSAGCASIIAAVDILLFKINSDSYGYIMAIIWILFVILYYLSLLPKFNSEDESDREYAQTAGNYPRFLEILIAYIAIPLVAVYTLVLLAYFIKILVTLNWPSGQLGPMVLAYAAAGLIIYILAGRLETRPAVLYRLIFPKVLIPVVIMQLISVGIRLNAFGVTESRYYVALFGVYSIICAVILSFKPVARNSLIVLLAAGFAVVSIIPPVDAFTVSRVSQITRLENMLQTEGVLVDGKIKPKADVSMDVRIQSTSILNYLQNRKYIEKVKWLPADFDTNTDMKDTLGFETAYTASPGEVNYFSAGMDMADTIDISGYDTMYTGHSYRGQGKNEINPVDFKIDNVKYQLSINRISPQETRVSVKNADGVELVGTGLYDFAKSLRGSSAQSKEALSQDKMTLMKENNGYKLRILFQNVNITFGSGSDAGADYDFVVMFSVPK